MKRRKLMIGVGSVAVGGSLAAGSGAFSSVKAQREIELSIVPDSDAYLKLMPGGEGDRASTSDGGISFSFPGDNEDASATGLGRDSVYEFKRNTDGDGELDEPPLFTVENQGTNEVDVWGEQPFDEDDDGNSLPDMKMLDVGGDETQVLSNDDPATIDTGELLNAGLLIDTHGVEVNEDEAYTVPLLIHANETADE